MMENIKIFPGYEAFVGLEKECNIECWQPEQFSSKVLDDSKENYK